MKRDFKKTLLSLGLMSTLFMGCGPSADDVLKKAKIWNDKSEKITIEQYSGAVQSSSNRVEIYQNTKEKLSKTALGRLNTIYAWENLQGMKCEENDVTYRVKVSEKNNSTAEYFSANIHCNSTEGKKFISVISIEKLIEVLEE